MRVCLLTAAIICFAMLTSAEATETSAKPWHRVPPPYPAKCLPAEGDLAETQMVTIGFAVTRNGATEKVHVIDSTDTCFDEVSIAAVRNWEYEPRDVNGVSHEQEDLEAIFTFVLNEETQTEDYDARPMVRVPPEYPQRCRHRADDAEGVLIEFDVTVEGETENIRVIESSNPCFDIAATKAASKWKYRPKVLAGQPVVRKGVQTYFAFEVGANASEFKVRRRVSNRFKKVRRLLLNKSDPQSALAELAKIEEEYGNSFSRAELELFHKFRASARIEIGDYAGALDDLRIVQKSGLRQENREAVDETILQLEAAIARQETATPQENN